MKQDEMSDMRNQQQQVLFYKFQNIETKMCYTNVVFKQNVGRTVNRDQVEKQRIDDRVGFQARFQTAEKQRFNKNHEVNDRFLRQHERDRKDHFYEARLVKRMERDEKRWEQQAKKEQFEENKIQHKHKVLTENRRNTNGIGYNPISHEYEASERGKKLESYDEGKQVNRYVRSKNIIEKTISAYNIITGETNTHIKQVVPQKYRNRVQDKFNAKMERQKVKYEPIRDKYDYLDDE